jgi:hypothetical protein
MIGCWLPGTCARALDSFASEETEPIVRVTTHILRGRGRARQGARGRRSMERAGARGSWWRGWGRGQCMSRQRRCEASIHGRRQARWGRGARVSRWDRRPWKKLDGSGGDAPPKPSARAVMTLVSVRDEWPRWAHLWMGDGRDGPTCRHVFFVFSCAWEAGPRS